MNLKFIIIPARNCWYYFDYMNKAISTIEYQIFIGCHDVNTEKELVTEEELRNKVSSIFEKKLIDFSMISLKGGFL